MRSLSLFALASALVAVPALTNACGDDPGNDQPSGGTGAGSSTGANGSGAGSQGGGGMVNNKETETVSGDIDANTTWTSDKNYLMSGTIRVRSGATLTIEPGTTIYGEKASTGALVVSQGGKLIAEGTPDEPIVFTSELPSGQRAAGDWGGVVILGRAPINEAGGTAAIEGFTTDEIYGGSDPDDDSGSLEYVRIEFSGIEISPDNEINGLTFGGVGRGTNVSFVQVRHTLDDCFEFFGGTVDADHLVCYRNGDDAFDFDQGYIGNLQFLFLQQDPNLADDTHGFEADNDKEAPDTTPVTNPTIYNVTLCGQNGDMPVQQYGFLFRRGFNATIGNTIVTGFEAGVDFRDTPFTDVTLTDSTFFGNSVENIAYVEDGSNEDTQEDDDDGFDERAWFLGGAGNDEVDPGLMDCFASEPMPMPASEIAGGTPPAGFDTSATYRGAFKDGSDNWLEGAWTSWSAN